ncbi:MAG: DciA family protein [Pseudomonadota bacterium]
MAKRPKGYGAAKPVGALASKVLDPVMRKRAGMTLDLIAHWPQIVGGNRSRLSRPKEVKWSRKASAEDAYQPATLIITCAPAVALIVQHDTDAIRARVNSFFGFEAVGRIAVEQGDIDPDTGPDNRAKSADLQTRGAIPSADLERKLAHIDDPDLKAALLKMGQSVFSDGSGKDK